MEMPESFLLLLNKHGLNNVVRSSQAQNKTVSSTPLYDDITHKNIILYFA